MGWTKQTVLPLTAGLLCAVIFGCSKQPDSFLQVLAKIDALGPESTSTAFAKAAGLAGTSVDKLRLLKRARLIDSTIAANTAALLAVPGSSSVVALAALDAYLESDRLEAALELFRTMLPPADFPLEFAETYIYARKAGLSPILSDSDRASLVAAYDATGWPEFLHEAIFDSLAAGDTGLARILLNEAMEKGVLIGTRNTIEILWQYGFFDLILALGPADSGYPALAAYADSAYLNGHKALATSVYAELIDRYPQYSWKPYAALGRIAEQSLPAVEDEPLPLTPAPQHRIPESGYWYTLLLSRFPEESPVILEYGLWLARQGSRDEAASFLDTKYRNPGMSDVGAAGRGGVYGSADIESSARLALAGMEYLPLAAVELAARFPESALAVDSALAALFFSASWQRFLSLNSWRRVTVPRGWFWDAASYALTGDFDAALDWLAKNTPMIPGFEVFYTLASFEFAAERFKEAASSYMMAAGQAGSAAVRARSLVRTGDSLIAAGEPGAAEKAYLAALSLEAFNLEAMAALRRLSSR